MDKKNRISIMDIQQLIQEKVRECTLCGSANWHLEPDLFTLRLSSPWTKTPSKHLHSVLLICSECGNTHFLNVDVLEVNLKNKKTSAVRKGGKIHIEKSGKPEDVDDIPFIAPSED